MLHLQNFDIIRIIVPQTAKIEHHTGQNSLDCIFFIAGSGEGQGDTSIVVLDPNFGLGTTDIIDGGFGHGYNGADSGTDNVGAGFGIAAVTGDGKAGDPVILRKKFASCHNYRAILVISTLV